MREPLPPPPPRLLDRVRAALRTRHCSLRTEKAYLGWTRRDVLFHGKRHHPTGMGAAEVTRFLSDLAVQGNVAASTQNQALSALLFLYRAVLEQELPWLDPRGKDRVTMLPAAVSRDLAKHLETIRDQHEAGIRAGAGWVELPWALARAGNGSGSGSSPPPHLHRENRQRRRHHLHESVLRRAAKEAVRSKGIPKRATYHTFRHSFATHVLNRGPAGVRSPADRLRPM